MTGKQISNSAWFCLLPTLFLPTDLCYADEELTTKLNHDEIPESALMPEDREHWSLLPITNPELPQIKDFDKARQPVDYFILRRLEDRGLTLAPEASRETLIRRIKFDLLGLPPTPDEIIAFSNDLEPMACERLVDHYLASPRYGERWAQYWLDLARFAETDGFEHDKVRPEAWRYRDWIINALNSGMGYDQFVRLQLCGDSVEPTENRIATYFALAGPDMPDINEQDLRRHDKLNELTGTIGTTLLGLTFQCAQCHDHKYDPISQADFYRLRAIFEPAIPTLQRNKQVIRLEEQDKPTEARFYRRGDLSGAGPAVRPAFPRLACTVDGVSHCSPRDARKAFCDWLFADDNPLTARVIANRVWQHHFGNPLTENPNDLGIVAGGPTHEQLLDWLASELRESDWSLKQLHRSILLSATYRQAGIASLKETAVKLSQEADPKNDLFAFFSTRRLEGETIRDAMLSTAGLIDLQRGGEGVRPPLPPELVKTLLRDHWKVSENKADHVRRSIYVFARRNLRYPIFDAFDRPDAGATCAMRNRSTTAVQSLHLLNSQLTLDCAEGLAARILSESLHKDANFLSLPTQEIVRRATNLLFRLTLGRAPANKEAELINTVIEKHLPAAEFTQQQTHDKLHSALVSVAISIFNTNEFIYLD
ncbi:MAG: DUF1549 and DUF1553 domain-containing protein [Planctomycetota bacterium]|nr:DUF1549 and DUF1553 domain-containing protein [Planctomycetota bacterium]